MTPFYICIVSRANQKEIILQCNYLHQDGGTPEHNNSCQHWDSFLTFMNGQSTWESDRNSFSRTMFKEQTGHIHSSLISSLSTASRLKAGDLKVYRYHLLCRGLHLDSVLCCQRHRALNPAVWQHPNATAVCPWRDTETLDLLLHPCKHTYPRGKQSS